MDATAPVGRDELAAVRPEPNCKAVFDAHRDELASVETLEAAVGHLYEASHRDYDADERVPDQGAAFIFASLVDQADLATFPAERSGDASFEPLPLVDRLERLFWDAEVVPWWLAVRFGAHYSLVTYWMWEANIPLMRRNIPVETLERIDAADASE